MSFVLNIPSTFKTSTIPSIFGDNVLTGNQTLNGDLKVNQSMTLGSGIMENSSYESMEITQTLRVDEHSIFNSAIVEQSMNVVSSSQMNDVSASNMELTNLNVGLDSTINIIQSQDISLSSLEVTNIDICGHLQVPDISFSNIEVEKLMLSDLSVNNATIANLSVNSVELETTSLSNKFSILANEVSQVFSGQSSVLYAFMAKGLSNYSISSGTTIPFVTNVSGCFETELSSFSNYSYTIDGSSSGIWHFGVHGHCINTSTTDLRLGIFRNDELIIQSQITQQNIHIHSTFECETNDVIQVKCTMGTGYIDLSNSCFFGYKYNPSNNNIQQNTDVLVNSLDMSHNENVTIEQGHLLLESGNLQINQLTSGNIELESGNIKLDSGNIYANQLDVSNIITTQLLGNMDLCGNLSIQSSDYSISNERLMFDTIVVRRPSGVVSSVSNPASINLRELQCWVNDTNILFDNSSSLTSYFALWTDKSVNVNQYSDYYSNRAYDNIINNNDSSTGLAASPDTTNSNMVLIIKNIQKHL